MNNIGGFIALSISSGLFSGFIPGKITGKAGSGGGLAGSILALLLQVWMLVSGINLAANILLALIALVLGLYTVETAEKFMRERWGTRKRHTGEYTSNDFNETNIDEIVGQLIAGSGAFVIQTNLAGSLVVLLISFVAFRYFDTKKPLGIKKVEEAFKYEYPALSIMLDDVVGGAYAMIVGFMAGGIVLIVG